MAPGASVLTPPAGTGESDLPQGPAPEASGQPGTSPTPTVAAAAPSTNLVGGGSDAYNPNAAQPYSAPAPVPVTPLQPAASALGPEPEANGAVNHAGAIAFAVDKGLRGYMKGLAIRQVNQGIQLQKQSVGLQQNLDTASKQLYALAQAGTDQNSPQYQAALNQVTAAHQAQLDFMKQHVAGEQIDKKTGQLKPQQGSIASRLFQTQDPAAIPLAAYQAAQALGPPVLHQIAPFQTPQYQAYAKTQAQTAGLTNQNALAAQQSAAQKGTLQTELNTLNAKRPEDLSDQERERRDQLGDVLGQPTEAAAAKSELIRRVLASNAPIAEQTRLIAQINSKGQGAFTPQGSKPAVLGTFGDQLARIAAEHNTTADKIPSSVVDALKARWAWDNTHSTSNSHTVLVEGRDPNTGEQTKTPVKLGGGTAPGPRPTIPGGWDDPAEHALPDNIVHPSAATGAMQARAQALSTGKTLTQANAIAKSSATSVQQSWLGSLSSNPGTIHTGMPGKTSPMENKAYQLEDTAKEQLQLGLHASTSLDDQGLMTAWSKGHLGGRVAQQELTRIQSVGSAEVRLEGNVAKLISGKLSPEQHAMFVKGLQDNYDAVHKIAQNYRTHAGGTGAAVSGKGGGSGTPPPASEFDPTKDFIVAH